MQMGNKSLSRQGCKRETVQNAMKLMGVRKEKHKQNIGAKPYKRTTSYGPQVSASAKIPFHTQYTNAARDHGCGHG